MGVDRMSATRIAWVTLCFGEPKSIIRLLVDLSAVASTRVQSWGRSAEKGWGRVRRRSSPPHPGSGLGRGNFFLFSDLEVAYFGEF